jgi:hypothetical protein
MGVVINLFLTLNLIVQFAFCQHMKNLEAYDGFGQFVKEIPPLVGTRHSSTLTAAAQLSSTFTSPTPLLPQPQPEPRRWSLPQSTPPLPPHKQIKMPSSFPLKIPLLRLPACEHAILLARDAPIELSH